MAFVKRRGSSYCVRWKELVASKGRGGDPVRSWKDRSRTFPSKASADAFARDVEIIQARGEKWKDQSEAVVATLGDLHSAYAEAPRNDRTRRWRRAMIGSFVSWAGAERPVSDLSASLLAKFAATLPDVGRAASTRYRKVLGVEGMWAWGYSASQRETFAGIPEPVRICGTDTKARVQPPPPVVRVAVPTLADVDLMIGRLRAGWRHGDAHRRVALLTRYTGLRISQAVGLNWTDIRLDHPGGPYIVLRSNTRGAKKGRARVVPLHPALAAEIRTWGGSTGHVFAATNERWTRGESSREAMRTAWIASGVDPAKWDVPTDDEEGERGHGTPTHAVRAAVFTELLRNGCTIDVAEYLIGHATSATRAAYVPESTPEASPLWARLVEAVGRMPAHAPRHGQA